MPQQLFREEVLALQQSRHLGEIRVAQRRSSLWAVCVASLLAIGLIAFLIFGQVSRKVRIGGVLLPSNGLIQVDAPQTGVLAELMVREGEVVSEGQPILRVRTPRTLANGDAAALAAQTLNQRVTALGAERRLMELQADQREQALRDKIRSLQAESRQAKGELEAADARVTLAEKNQARYDALAREGFVSALQAQQRQEELLDLQLRQRSAQRNLEALQRDTQSMQADVAGIRLSLQASQSQLDREIAALRMEGTENEARSSIIVTAPQRGIVGTVSGHVGQTVQPGQSLVTILPGRGLEQSQGPTLQAQLYGPSRSTGFVQSGQTVWLRYAAYPYQKFGMARGQVATISQAPIAPQDLPAGQAQALLQAAKSNEPLYRVTVLLDAQAVVAFGQRHPLRAGMQLDADVMQERRAIWEWVLEPILATSGIASSAN